MDERHRQAFLDTDYWVETPEEWIRVRIGESNPALDRLLDGHLALRWAFVTPDNPGSQPHLPRENQTRRLEFRQEVKVQGLPAIAIGRKGDWPPEPGLLLLGISREEAIKLARRWGQLAIVAGEKGRPPELVDCADLAAS